MKVLPTYNKHMGDIENDVQILSSCWPENHEGNVQNYVSMLLGGQHTSYIQNFDRRQHVKGMHSS